jgi:hypothetical protein
MFETQLGFTYVVLYFYDLEPIPRSRVTSQRVGYIVRFEKKKYFGKTLYVT